jgi:hypothetical protein
MSGLAAVHCNQHPYMLISSCIRNKCAWVVRCKCLIEYNALRGGADGIDPVHVSNWPIRPNVFEKKHTGTPMVTLETQRNDPKSVTEPPSGCRCHFSCFLATIQTSIVRGGVVVRCSVSVFGSGQASSCWAVFSFHDKLDFNLCAAFAKSL